MIQVDIRNLVPAFIFNDKNGYAAAKAIEKGLQIFCKILQDGLDTAIHVEKMPEWRLDEMAWELNCLYDYNASIDRKRIWIRDAMPMYACYGTIEAVYLYLSGYFADVEVEENWQYGGQPYHFRVTVDGEWTPENAAWAQKAISTAKNVRSVMDNLRIGSSCVLGILATGEVLARFDYPLTGAENWAGRWPQENTMGVLDASLATGIHAEAEGHNFPYPMTCERIRAGTIPQENLMGIARENGIQDAQAEDTYAKIIYTLCGQDEV